MRTIKFRGKSKDTKNEIEMAKRMHKPIEVHIVAASDGNIDIDDSIFDFDIFDNPELM